MKKPVNISKTVGKSGLNDVFLHRLWFFLMWSFLVLGSLTVVFYGLSMLAGGSLLRFLAYLAGMLATAALLGWIAFFTALFARIVKGFPDDRVLAALRSTLRGPNQDPNPFVRFEAAKGLAELELEQHSYHHEHHDLDDRIFERYE